MPDTRSRNLTASAIFAGVFALLFIFHSHRFVATNDEGMILEPAQRMLSGARPYVDFFGYMSPGSYWIQAQVYRVFGVAMWTSRVVVMFDLSLECALVFWIVARVASRRAAVAAVLIFAGFQIADPSYVTSAHRWDSAALALAGVAAGLSEWKWRWVASGALLAAATWCTPALALVGGAVVLFLAIRERGGLAPFAAGIATVSIPAVAALGWTGTFGAFLKQLAWLRTNYAAVNVMPYGSIIGGYRALFEGSANAAEAAVRAVLVLGVALPAILPVAAVGLFALRGRRRDLELLTLAAVAITATVFPRADVAHLMFIEALPLVVCVAALTRFPRAGAALAMAGVVLAGIFGMNFFTTLRGTEMVASPIGELRVASQQAPDLAGLVAKVRPRQGLFVYPYMPIVYVATQTTNPTRFSYLAPGMMTEREASEALDELRASPPEWVLYMKLSREEFLRVFPHATGLDWHFASLEEWLDANYAPVEPAVSLWGYRLCRRNGAVGEKAVKGL